MKTDIAWLVTCEHGVNIVPAEYAFCFRSPSFSQRLNTHEAIDFGALTIARGFSQTLSCELVDAKVTRLLIDCNRSLHHRDCFSDMTRHLPQEQKRALINQYYLPYQEIVIQIISNHVQRQIPIWHLSIHSFTPQLNGIIRHADIGLLYDPKRRAEQQLAKKWQLTLKNNSPSLRVRLNYPYKGISDGLTTLLRKRFPEKYYLGLEVEFNQHLTHNELSLLDIQNTSAKSLLIAKSDILMSS